MSNPWTIYVDVLGNRFDGLKGTMQGRSPRSATPFEVLAETRMESKRLTTDQGTRARDHQVARIRHWNVTNRRFAGGRGWGAHYHCRLSQVFKSLVARGARVLEVGCGEGDLLAAVAPGVGVGIDFSDEALRSARKRHPGLRFVQADAHALPLSGKFDAIILSDLLNDLYDVQATLEAMAKLCHKRTRLIINSYSRVWEPVLTIAARLGLAKSSLEQNWLTVADIRNMLHLAGLEVIRSWSEVIFPLPVPWLEPLFNRILVRFWPLYHLALTNFIVARRIPQEQAHSEPPLVTVVVPARNEEGNIPQVFERTPEMGRGTELVFVEGHSSDGTRAAIEREIARHPERDCRLLVQFGEGKGDAVRMGFVEAKGDLLMILDADLTVSPEDLPRFYRALVLGRGELANGVRLIYPLPGEAMRFLNLVANKAFSLVLSWVLGQQIKDTLCGTKALWKSDYEAIAAQRSYFGDIDPFGDFDLVLGAARLNLKIVDIPVRYSPRIYGRTNIRRWEHGLLLARMLQHAARRLKFI